MTSPDDQTQTNQIKEILLEASRLGAHLFRRNIGMGWIGAATRYNRPETVAVRAGDVLIRQARPFHNGIKGQADTYGWKSVRITPEMVGRTVAVHVEIEAKHGRDSESPEQVSWRNAVTRAGGIAGVARVIEDVRRILSGGR